MMLQHDDPVLLKKISFPSSVLLFLQIGGRLFCSKNNDTDDFLYNVLLSHRIVEMLYHSINNGGCGFLLLWFLFVRNFFWNKTGSSAVCDWHA